jgi:hypothetical protein
MKAELDWMGYLEERGDESIREDKQGVASSRRRSQPRTISAAPRTQEIGTSACGNKPCPQPGASKAIDGPTCVAEGSERGLGALDLGSTDKGSASEGRP